MARDLPRATRARVESIEERVAPSSFPGANVSPIPGGEQTPAGPPCVELGDPQAADVTISTLPASIQAGQRLSQLFDGAGVVLPIGNYSGATWSRNGRATAVGNQAQLGPVPLTPGVPIGLDPDNGRDVYLRQHFSLTISGLVTLLFFPTDPRNLVDPYFMATVAKAGAGLTGSFAPPASGAIVDTELGPAADVTATQLVGNASFTTAYVGALACVKRFNAADVPNVQAGGTAGAISMRVSEQPENNVGIANDASCAATGTLLSYTTPSINHHSSELVDASAFFTSAGPTATIQLQLNRGGTIITLLQVVAPAASAPVGRRVLLQQGDIIRWQCTTAVAGNTVDLMLSVVERAIP